MSQFKAIAVPNSPLEVTFTDDADSQAKVFVSIRSDGEGLTTSRRPFSSFSQAVRQGYIGGSMIDGTHRLSESEDAFLQTLTDDVTRYTWAMNVAVHQEPGSADDEAAREILREFGDAAGVLDRSDRGPAATFGMN